MQTRHANAMPTKTGLVIIVSSYFNQPNDAVTVHG